MITPVEKRNNKKIYEFHGEVGHNTDECMHLRRQIIELIKAEKLSHVIKELKQGSGKDQPKAAKKGETSRKDKPLAILMVQPWHSVTRQRITQSFSLNPKFSFPPLGDEDGVRARAKLPDHAKLHERAKLHEGAKLHDHANCMTRDNLHRFTYSTDVGLGLHPTILPSNPVLQ
ncbi:hypothetical protein Tco_0616192 [Tanacetum coccineum]